MFWTIFLISIALFLFYYVFVKPLNYWKRKNVKQDIPLPIIGDGFKILFGMESIIDHMKRVCSDGKERYHGMYVMMIHVLMIKDPELIKQITIKDFDYFTDHRNNLVPKDTDPLFSKNLFCLTGDNWRDMRSTLSPAFTSSKMRSMFTLINDCAKQYTKHYLQQNQNEIVMNIKDSFTRYANDIIASCAFGINCNSLKERNNEFYLKGIEASDFSKFWRILKIYIFIWSPTIAKILKFNLFSVAVSNFFQTIVKDTLKIREKQHIIRPDMIHLLMEAKKGCLKQETDKIDAKSKKEITDFDIAAQAFAFFFAGFDTVSTLMSFVAYELAINPNVQEKLRNEIKQTKEACNDNLSYEDLSTMKYLDMVISETLRKWPPFIGADRVCVKSYTIEAKHPGESPVHLNVGDIICLPIIALHYHPEFYPNPDCFNPDRFSEENKHNIKPYTYLPFGSGPRKCIGYRFALMETKAVFYYILQHFEITVVEKTVLPVKLDKRQIFTISARGGVWLGLKKKEI